MAQEKPSIAAWYSVTVDVLYVDVIQGLKKFLTNVVFIFLFHKKISSLKKM